MSNHSLLASWRQSLSLLRWSNLKLFLLVSFKAIKDQWKLLLAGALLYVVLWLWIFIPFRLWLFTQGAQGLVESVSGFAWYQLFQSILQGVFVALCCFVLRPSVDNKYSFDYYKKFFHWEILFSIILIPYAANLFKAILSLPFLFLGFVWLAIKDLDKVPFGMTASFTKYLLFPVGFILFSWTISFYYFLFDASQKESFKFFHALNRGLNFILYNVPILLIGSGFYVGIIYVIAYVYQIFRFEYKDLFFEYINVFNGLRVFFVVVNVIIFLAFLSTLYTKKVYEQYELYFSKQ